MRKRYAQPVEDYMTSNMVLIFMNLLWIFIVLWSLWGVAPVLILSALIDHLITRLETARRSRAPARPPAAKPDL